MAKKKDTQTALNSALVKATAEANEIFGKIGKVVEKEIKGGASEIDVVKVGKAAGLELDKNTLDELKIDRTILVHPWIPWYVWYPWRPLWCWWWHRYHPWYRCCPWWWYRCHWYTHPQF